MKLPIGAITPKGWLRHQFEFQSNGMNGNLEQLSPWLDFTKSSWTDPQGRGRYGWEEFPYWIKGYGDLGYILGDKKIIANATKGLKAGDQWKPMQTDPDAYTTRRDAWNPVTFSPVETSALRLTVQLQPGESGGILEWKVE